MAIFSSRGRAFLKRGARGLRQLRQGPGIVIRDYLVCQTCNGGDLATGQSAPTIGVENVRQQKTQHACNLCQSAARGRYMRFSFLSHLIYSDGSLEIGPSLGPYYMGLYYFIGPSL